MSTQDKSEKLGYETHYQIQRALAAMDQMKDAIGKINLPFVPETALATEAVEMLQVNIRSAQMLLLVISVTDLKRHRA